MHALLRGGRRCLMPRTAMATSAVERIADSDDEASTTRVNDLIQRGRSQGHLSLAELRTAFDEAGLTPAEGRSILRELSEAGVRLANELTEPKRTPKARTTARAAAAPKARAAKEPERAADSAPEPGDDADAEVADTEVMTLEAEADKLVEVDLDDQTPAMGDSVHTYL